MPLMEVFNIVYLGTDKVRPEKQLGTIKLFSSNNQCGQYLYREEEVDFNKLPLKYGDAIVTTIKAPAFTHEEDFVYMEFDLFGGDYKGTVHLPWRPRSNEVSLWCVEFDSVDYTGKIVVNIGRFSRASVAKVEVNLLITPFLGHGSPVYGDIFASNSKLDSSDAASVLFHKNSNDIVLVGRDGVIPLVKSYVAVPFNSVLDVDISLNVDGYQYTATASFDAKESAPPEEFFTVTKKLKFLVTVTWGQSPASGMDVDVQLPFNVNQGPLSARMGGFEHLYRLLPISKYILSRVLCDCEHCLHLSTSVRAIFVEQLHPIFLFNLIQAAHHLHMESLMNLTCQTLVNKVKGKSVEEIMIEFSMDKYNIQVERLVTRTFSEEDIFHPYPADVEIPPRSRRRMRMRMVSILRQRQKETFINRSHLVDVPVSPFAIKRLPLIKDRNTIFCRCVGDFLESAGEKPEKQLEAIRWLDNLISGDPGFADGLSPIVKHLLKIVMEIENSNDGGYIIISIQSLAVHILSHAVTRWFHDYAEDAISAFVKLMSHSRIDFKTVGVIALTRVANARYKYIPFILAMGALEKAHEIAIKFKSSSSHKVHELIRSVAKFLAVISRGCFPQDKVAVALAILENLFENDSLLNHDHVVSASYALQYLTYERSKLVGGVSTKIIRKLIGVMFNCCTNQNTEVACAASGVPGSVLAIVGNIARWGSANQIKILTEDEDSQLLHCLGRMLCSVYKKFNEEACQIISNIAARRETWIKDMHKANLIEPLCSLLKKDMYMYESNVKLEAAWALFNGIYGDEYRPIDHFTGSQRERMWLFPGMTNN